MPSRVRPLPEPDLRSASDAPAGTSPAGASVSAELEERLIGSETVHRGRYLEFRIETVELPDGRTSTREIVGHPGAVAIVAVDDEDRVLLVRQYRLAAERILLEIPAGTLDRDPATGATEAPELAGPRELEEETGQRAASWRLLGSFWTAPGFATELMHLYLATGLSPVHQDRLGPDWDERVELVRVPWRDAIGLIERGEIRDAKSVAGLMWLAHMRAGGA
jgi:ADP-ribose pyrophosphatase